MTTSEFILIDNVGLADKIPLDEINFNLFEQGDYIGSDGKIDKLVKNCLEKTSEYELFNHTLYKLISDYWIGFSRNILFKHKFEITIPKIQYYKSNEGYYSIHSDASPFANRALAFLFYANDVDVGGETVFPIQNKLFKPVRDRLLLFPPYWSYPHEGRIPISNDKIIITGFLNIIEVL